jgi:nucleoside-diphosphate-sugar epimerase
MSNDAMQQPMQELRVAVTGGSGKVGREAIRALIAAGHVAVNFDLRPSPDGVRTVTCDMADFGQAMGALSGADLTGGRFDAVVHLAGVPGPFAPDHVVFTSHTLATYNVFSACQRLGILRIVWASSESLAGQPFPEPPQFVPMDESVSQPVWSYTLAKQLGETMAENFVRWTPGTSITSLRFSNVFAVEDYAGLAAIQADPSRRRLNLWAYVDARDCGEACRLAVEAALPGHEALLIAATDNVMGIATAELMARYFPGVPENTPLHGDASLLSIEKAKRLLGFMPRHGWRDMLVR